MTRPARKRGRLRCATSGCAAAAARSLSRATVGGRLCVLQGAAIRARSRCVGSPGWCSRRCSSGSAGAAVCRPRMTGRGRTRVGVGRGAAALEPRLFAVGERAGVLSLLGRQARSAVRRQRTMQGAIVAGSAGTRQSGGGSFDEPGARSPSMMISTSRGQRPMPGPASCWVVLPRPHTIVGMSSQVRSRRSLPAR